MTLGDVLYKSGFGMALKPAIGGAIGAAVSWMATSGMHPLIIVTCAAAAPPIINWFNGKDPRVGYGRPRDDIHDVLGDDAEDLP